MIITNAQIKIRSSAGYFDKLFLSNLSKKAFGSFGDYGEIVLKWFESEYSRTLIATYKEMPVGFAMLGKPDNRNDPDNSAELLAIAVVSEYSRLGIGSNLMKRIDKIAYEMGAKTLLLHTGVENKCAIKLFKNSGFKPWQIKNKFYPKGQDAFVMTKELNNL